MMSMAFVVFMQRDYAGTSTLGYRHPRQGVEARPLFAVRLQTGDVERLHAERTVRMRVPLDLPPPRNRAAMTAIWVAFGTIRVVEMSRPEVLAACRLAILEAERAPDVARTPEVEGRATLTSLAGLVRSPAGGPVPRPGQPPSDGRNVHRAGPGGLLVRLRLADAPDERRLRVGRERPPRHCCVCTRSDTLDESDCWTSPSRGASFSDLWRKSAHVIDWPVAISHGIAR